MDTVLEQPVGVEAQPEVNEERVATFTDAQQALFNKAFRRREAKLRREYEAKITELRGDLTEARRDVLELAETFREFLPKLHGRITVEQEAMLLDGLAELFKDYAK